MKARFGSFTLDSGRQQLLAGGREVPLSPKALALLQLLIERRPDVVDKETMVSRVWFGAHVTDAALTVVVAELRKALGDSAEKPQFIRTVHRRGYAFCAAVDELALESGRTLPRAWLVIGDRRVLLPAGSTTVGRDPEAGVWLDVPSVSWRHARIEVAAGGITIEDLGSTNGTFVRGRRVREETALAHGDTLRFGQVDARFGVSAAAAAARTERLRTPGS
jgi:DNA-binding winged helix-turn-helix (wHTH) protein